MNTHFIEKGIDLLSVFGPKIISAIILLLIGNWVIKKIMHLARKASAKKQIDISLQKFLLNVAEWGLKIFLIITVLGQLGVATSSFVAIIGAAGLAVGLALQGSLANFAGGALIMLFKPYKIGDMIEAQGEKGVVKDIQIFTTILNTPENKTAIIPNGALSNGNIINYSHEGVLRVDLSIGVSYDADLKKAKDVLLSVMQKYEHVLSDPAPSVFVSELADSSVNIALRPFVKSEHYWTVYGDILEQSKTALEDAHIEIPYPHMVLHNYQK
ncbi:MAG: mechanosensitive ion channel family protein [Minisyncoccia bacterium]